MKYEVDFEYEFRTNKAGLPFFPAGLSMDANNLYIFPNGKYLSPDACAFEDGSLPIYEPYELCPFKDLIADDIEE